jgi:hypothetical protein
MWADMLSSLSHIGMPYRYHTWFSILLSQESGLWT